MQGMRRCEAADKLCPAACLAQQLLSLQVMKNCEAIDKHYLEHAAEEAHRQQVQRPHHEALDEIRPHQGQSLPVRLKQWTPKQADLQASRCLYRTTAECWQQFQAGAQGLQAAMPFSRQLPGSTVSRTVLGSQQRDPLPGSGQHPQWQSELTMQQQQV